MLIETSPASATILPATPSLRQGRFEEKLARVIAAGCPRSTIRAAVEQLADQLRWQQVPASRGVAMIMDVVARAAAETRAFDTQADCLALVTHWATRRYARAD